MLMLRASYTTVRPGRLSFASAASYTHSYATLRMHLFVYCIPYRQNIRQEAVHHHMATATPTLHSVRRRGICSAYGMARHSPQQLHACHAFELSTSMPSPLCEVLPPPQPNAPPPAE
jgi:hypothetical protein